MRIVTLNLRSGGGKRTHVLVDAIAAHDADVVVLTEFRCGASGDRLRTELAKLGYAFEFNPEPPPRTNSVHIASRLPATGLKLEDAGRHIVGCTIGGLSLIGVYMPQAREKERYWRAAILPLAAELVTRDAVLIGDFNTGDARDRTVRTPFFAEAELAELMGRGWIDAWRSLHPDAHKFTWYSQAGNGFLLDHAYLSPGVAAYLADARLSHLERERRITDHSALIVELFER